MADLISLEQTATTNDRVMPQWLNAVKAKLETLEQQLALANETIQKLRAETARSMSSGADRAMLKTADGATWLTPDELLNTVRGLLTTQEAMDGDAVEIPAGWRVEEMRYAEGMTLRVSRLCVCEEDRNRSFLGVGFVV